ncbi:MAG: acyl-CoA dehydrogenase family protein [Chromatiales bacterium]|nr:acyl-CoA dehydrogenase family protein [Chromatiales bacterium]MDH4013706.1 acyl-CoA dehydrogenase family protein [Chromatiales bacterium]
MIYRAARAIASNAVQRMGGYGYSRECPMERRLRDACSWGFAGGAVDIQKLNIASAVAGLLFDQRR